MTVNEFILLDKAKVRRDSNLMHLYLEFFKEAFGRIPNCAGCSFATDWQKLVSLYSIKGEKKVTLQKVNLMKTITIKKIQGKILTYRKDGKTFRQYDNILTDAFIKEYVSNGTEEEIKERLKMFVFPVENEFLDSGKSVEEVAKDYLDAMHVEDKEKLEAGLNEYLQRPVTAVKKRGPKKRK